MAELDIGLFPHMVEEITIFVTVIYIFPIG